MVDVLHIQSDLVVGWGRQDGPMVSVAVVGLLAGTWCLRVCTIHRGR